MIKISCFCYCTDTFYETLVKVLFLKSKWYTCTAISSNISMDCSGLSKVVFFTNNKSCLQEYKSFGLLQQSIALEDYMCRCQIVSEKYKDCYNCHSHFVCGGDYHDFRQVTTEDITRDQVQFAEIDCFSNVAIEYKNSLEEVMKNKERVTQYLCQIHANSLTKFTVTELPTKLCFINPVMTHTVVDALMYSPCMLNNSNSKPLFLLYQVLKLLCVCNETLPSLDVSYLSWKDIALDEQLWIQADIMRGFNLLSHNLNYVDPPQILQKPTSTYSRLITLNVLLDEWVSGNLSNYDYLMFLNFLAGRRLNDPHHHPILPWVSDLCEAHQGWRNLSRSKYRLNKGDDQLNLQYAMASSSQSSDKRNYRGHVPHHIPDMLSDITYYVYKARLVPRSILQKHVRSYWEPNEYPASIQRMHEWTPDECIPEFYKDPSVFFSIHPDMEDLSIPFWSNSPADFVANHLSMLESPMVSQFVSEWIDITFGYKLSGKHAHQAMNVCRHLVDQHVTPLNEGIVQLFCSPHPHRMTTQEEKTRYFCDSVGKNLLSISSSEDLVLTQPLCLTETYNPLLPLVQLEKLFIFKMQETQRIDISSTLSKECTSELHSNTCNLSQAISDRNLVMFICLSIEIFCAPQLQHSLLNLPLSHRFERASNCLKSNSVVLPTTITVALEYLLDCLADSVERVVVYLREFEYALMQNNLQNLSLRRIFAPSLDHDYPLPTFLHLITESMHILQFPAYFEDLYLFVETLMEVTNHHEVPIEESWFPNIKVRLVALLAQIHGTFDDGMDILLPHLICLFDQPIVYAAKMLVLIFDDVAQELGPSRTSSDLLPAVLRLFIRVNNHLLSNVTDTSLICNAVEILYDKSFLLQLCARCGFKIFLENFPPLLIECLTIISEYTVIPMQSIEWMLSTFGPAIASKYVIRPFLNVTNLYYCKQSEMRTTETQLLECLEYGFSLYGSPLLTLQYIPHVSFSVSSAISGISFNAQSCATLEAASTLLTYMLPCLMDHQLMEQLDTLSKGIIMPLIGILSSKAVRFPLGGEQRKLLCCKTIKLLLVISNRIGRDMSHRYLTEILQAFFSTFSQYNVTNEDSHFSDEEDFEEEGALPTADTLHSDTSSSTFEDLSVSLDPVLNISISDEGENQAPGISADRQNRKHNAHEEILEAFCPETAYQAYVHFTRIMGEFHMKDILNNHGFIRKLISQYEATKKEDSSFQFEDKGFDFNKNVAIVGNQITVTDQDAIMNNRPNQGIEADPNHLKGNWLAYWEHEIGLAHTDNHIHFNQINLQTFCGHSAGVKSIFVHDSEDWFMSGSKDKKVNIWSLQECSEEDVQPSFVYSHHKKPVFYSSLIESNNIAVSCDGSLHLWDPFTGHQIKTFESNEFKSSIVSLASLAAPQCAVLAATADTTLKVIDVRSQSLAQEYKTTVGPSVGVIRTLCTNRNWAAVGFTSGVISLIDLRMGPVLRMWQGQESDIIASCAVTGSTFLTASLDQTVVYWDFNNITPLMAYRSMPENVITMKSFYDEIISASGSNRIMVHPLPRENMHGVSSSGYDKPTTATRLRSDLLRGNLSTFAILPLKRQLLLSSDTGCIKLVA